MVHSEPLLHLYLCAVLLGIAQCSSPFQVNHFTTYHQRDVEVASLGTDKIVFVWESQDQDGSEYGVYARVMDVATGEDILPEFRVNMHTEGYQDDPAVAAVGDDKFVIVWESRDQEHVDSNHSSGNGVFLRVMSITGDDIIPEMQVNNYTLEDQDDPAVAVIGEDKIVVVWESKDQERATDDPANGIYARIITLTGEDVLPEFQVNSFTAGGQNDPSVAAVGDDKFVITWESYYQELNVTWAGYGVYARLMSTTGTDILPEFRVNQHKPESQDDAVVAAIGDDKFVVVWESFNQENTSGPAAYTEGVYARVMSVNGADLLPEFLVNTYAASDQDEPSVAALGDDKFVIAWESYNQEQNGTGDGNGVYARVISLSGADVVPEFQVNEYTRSGQSAPNVAAIGTDKFVVAWQSFGQDSSSDGVFARFVDVEQHASSCPEQRQWSNCRQSLCCASGLVCYEQNEWYAQCLEPNTCESLYSHWDGSQHRWTCTALSPDPTPVCEQSEPEWGDCTASHCCAEGLVCYEQNAWYAQCLRPGTCGSLHGHRTGEYAWTCSELSSRSATGSYALARSNHDLSAESVNGQAIAQDGEPTQLGVGLGVGALALLLLVVVALHQLVERRRCVRAQSECAAAARRSNVAVKSDLAYEVAASTAPARTQRDSPAGCFSVV